MSTMPVTIRTHTLTGSPSASPPRNVKKESSVGSPVTWRPSLSASASPRNIDRVASVATIVGIAMTWTSSALTRPAPPPSRIPSSAASQGAMPSRISRAETMSVSPNTEPDRQVELAHRQQERHARGEDADVDRLRQDVLDLVPREELGMQNADDNRERDGRDEHAVGLEFEDTGADGPQATVSDLRFARQDQTVIYTVFRNTCAVPRVAAPV